MSLVDKICTKCKLVKSETSFSKDKNSTSGLYSRCKECTKRETKLKSAEQKAKENERSRRYKLNNKDKVKQTAQSWYQRNKEKVIEYSKSRTYQNYSKHLERQRLYCSKNKEKRKEYLSKNKIRISETKRKRENYRYNNDLMFKIRKSLRARLNKALSRNYKTGSAVNALGISINDFKDYIEKLFQPGMSWENWGKLDGWEIDHIVPLSSFNLTNTEELNKACHYTNLQPLWSIDNRIKGNRLVKD